MTEQQKQQSQDSDKRLRDKNRVVAWGLVAFVVLVVLMTMARLGGIDG